MILQKDTAKEYKEQDYPVDIKMAWFIPHTKLKHYFGFDFPCSVNPANYPLFNKP